MKFNDCPICGDTPIIEKQSLDKGNGRGYPGHYSYHIHCSNRDCPLVREVPFFEQSDIYEDKNKVYEYLCEKWNEETVKINELILHRGNSWG